MISFRVLPLVYVGLMVLASTSHATQEFIGSEAGTPKRTAPLSAQQTGPVQHGTEMQPTLDASTSKSDVEGAPVASEDVHKLFAQADKDHNGVLTEQEFGYLQDNPEAQSMIESSMNLLTSGKGFVDALLNSVAMIIVTELGDKTFFIAAILAMTNDRGAVYAGALGAVAVMTVLSVVIGFALPALLPRQYTHYAAALLFVFFGIQLLREAPEKNDGVSEELAEVEEELAEEAAAAGEDGADVEAGDSPSSPRKKASRSVAGGSALQRGAAGASSGAAAPSRSAGAARKGAVAALGAGAWFAILLHAFSLTFVAEWGDRSQIATIAMAAAKEPFGVCLGGVIGHAICTGLAVLGGRLLASRISEKTVTYAGGALFLLFAAHSLYMGPEAM